MCWGSTPYKGGPDGTVGRLIASSAAIVSISVSISWITVIMHELRWPQGDPGSGLANSLPYRADYPSNAFVDLLRLSNIDRMGLR
jgi:hypothetical protein